MFNFFKFSKKDLLANEFRSESIIAHMRKSNIKQQDFEKLKQQSILFSINNSSISAIQELFSFINKAINYQTYGVVNNLFDFEFYYQDIVKISQWGSLFIGQQQIKIIIESLDILRPTITSLMEKETKIESIRKDTIENAGLKYTRHFYPNYIGCDELFYIPHEGSDDPIFEEAKKILQKRNNPNSLEKEYIKR